MSACETAREYAERILAMTKLPAEHVEDVSSLLFLAYMRGWSDATKDEIEFRKQARA